MGRVREVEWRLHLDCDGGRGYLVLFTSEKAENIDVTVSINGKRCKARLHRVIMRFTG
ncbi:MAG: hypothetical protein GSR80_000623 [Desulfurococcales archaeon]|nr:hypothetical protein [Desulfurococcales archaeon]